MSNILDREFRKRPFVTSPTVARLAQISDAQARARAADLGVMRAGSAYIWSREDVERLFDALDAEDECEDILGVEECGDDGDDDVDDDDDDEEGPEDDDDDD